MTVEVVHDVQEQVIQVEKSLYNKKAPERIIGQVTTRMDAIMTDDRRAEGWDFRVGDPTKKQVGDEERHTCDIRVWKKGAFASGQFKAIVVSLDKAIKLNGWQISKVNGEDWNPSRFDAYLESDQRTVSYADVIIPRDWRKHFQHLYGLDDQIEVIIRRIQAAINSGFTKRFHCALVGEPASGKTETAKALKAMLGDEAVLEYDATSTTAAGAVDDMTSREVFPRILILEELEKADMESTRWLLGSLDTRGEIRKVTYRTRLKHEARFLGIVTVNDYSHFKSVMSGALASRCGYPIWFPQPGRPVLEKILAREVGQVQGGKPDWIKPALDFADLIGMKDPRHIIDLCLSGGDQLLSGAYQKKFINTLVPHDKEAAIARIKANKEKNGST